MKIIELIGKKMLGMPVDVCVNCKKHNLNTCTYHSQTQTHCSFEGCILFYKGDIAYKKYIFLIINPIVQFVLIPYHLLRGSK